MIRFTPTGRVFLATSVVLYLASLTSQSGLLLFPIGILLGCFIVNFFGARQAVHRLDISMPTLEQVAEGEPLRQPWTVRNSSSRGAGLARVRNSDGDLLEILWAGPRTQTSLLPSLRYSRRGVYPQSGLLLASQFPFGLVEVTRPLKGGSEIVVHPALFPAPTPLASGFDAMVGGKYRGGRRTPAGTYFAGVRPFQPGDPVRQVHWKASSKGLGLMVKNFEEELSGRVSLFLDCSPAPALFDDAVRAAGSLAFAALDAGLHVEWFELGHAAAPMLFPPFTDGGPLLDRLARLTPAALPVSAADFEIAAGRAHRKSALAFVLSRWGDDAETSVAWLADQGRALSVYLPGAAANAAPGCRSPVFGYYPDRITAQEVRS